MEDNVSCSPSLRRFKPEALSVKASDDSVLNISEYIYKLLLGDIIKIRKLQRFPLKMGYY